MIQPQRTVACVWCTITTKTNTAPSIANGKNLESVNKSLQVQSWFTRSKTATECLVSLSFYCTVWSEYTAAETCSVTCGAGIVVKTRSCLSPVDGSVLDSSFCRGQETLIEKHLEQECDGEKSRFSNLQFSSVRIFISDQAIENGELGWDHTFQPPYDDIVNLIINLSSQLSGWLVLQRTLLPHGHWAAIHLRGSCKLP